jgi:hypothetical protein
VGDHHASIDRDALDSTFPAAGKIGLWSKADSQSYFDDLSVGD